MHVHRRDRRRAAAPPLVEQVRAAAAPADADVPTVIPTAHARIGLISVAYGLNTGPADEPWMVSLLDPAHRRGAPGKGGGRRRGGGGDPRRDGIRERTERGAGGRRRNAAGRPGHRREWCSLTAGPICTSADADQIALARTTAAVNLFGADADGARLLRLN